MNNLRFTGWLVIALTLIVALLLALLPLPHSAEAFRPAWLSLVLIYWGIALPHRVGLFTAWCCGLVLDALSGTLLGEQALGLVIIMYVAIKMHRRIRMFSMPGQAAMVLSLLLIQHALLFWIQGMQGQLVSAAWFWASPVIGACLWPWIYAVLTDCLRHYRLQ